jgi:YidC/Oxa1 family membrane protein insertase
MDRTSIIVIVVCFVLLGLWSFVLVPKLYPPRPMPLNTNNVATTAPGAVTNIPTPFPTTQTTSTSPTNVVRTVMRSDLTNAPTLVISNEEARYTFTGAGGGIGLVELLKFTEAVPKRRTRQLVTNDSNVATLNTGAILPTMAIEGENGPGDEFYQLIRTDTGVRAEKSLTNGLTIIKDFVFGTNYLINATVRLENHSSQPLAMPGQEWVVGTATPLGPRDTGQAVGALWYNGDKTEDIGTPNFSSTGFACIPRTPPAEYRAGSSNVFWVTVHNQFFALAVMPATPAQAVVIRPLELPRPVGEAAEMVATNAAAPKGYEAALVYLPFTLNANQTVERKLTIYAGPKEYQRLARIGDQQNNNLDLVMNFGWFGFVSKALLLGMNWLHHSLKFSYGWAIIAITLIIKTVFWPLTQASTRSMKRMQTLQPQMNAIREKYKDDPVKMNKKVMEYMREHKVSPVGGCLPMFLQIPVFIGFYRMIQSAIELRGAKFLWAGDLTQSDTVYLIDQFDFLKHIPSISIQGVGLPINVFPLIMGATMLWQARLTPPSPGMDPMQAKIMRYMPLMFMVFLYNFSAGLTLYWTVQNLLTIVQTKLTRATDPVKPAAVPVLTAGQKKRK